VRENIAIVDPAAPIEAVIHVAPDWPVRMNSSASCPRATTPWSANRAPAFPAASASASPSPARSSRNPRILIFDEATSALDYESEAIVQRNMAHICKGRTVFIIAHRLSAVRRADRIIVMDKGRIVEGGTHESLLGRPKGIYAHLWAMQDGGLPTEGAGTGVGTGAAV
jgi:subfamily B ATP-binding cassette protein HlyB/CyaB